MIIEDGKGSGRKAQVDADNRLRTNSINLDQQVASNNTGDAYNINSGNITFSAAGTLLYIKNNEDLDLVIETIIIGQGSGTTSNIGEMAIVRNPTGGDLISDATAVSQNANRNFGSNKTLGVLAYKGKSGGTLTGGSDAALVYVGTSGRAAIPINLLLPKGSSVGLKLDPKLSSGSVKAYAAAICYLRTNV